MLGIPEQKVHIMEYKEVGARVALLRTQHNYTREAFAALIKISPKFLYEIETGKKGFSIKTLYNISKTLSVSCDYIIFGEDMREDNIAQ